VKVTHLNTFTEGGAAEAALRLHNALLNENVDSKFLALYKGTCTDKEVYDFRDELSFIFYWLTKIKNKQKSASALRISKSAGEWYSDLTSVWKAQEHSLIKNADIVHLHWISNYVDIPSFLNSNKCTVELESFHFNNGIDGFLHALCDNSNDFKFIDWYYSCGCGSRNPFSGRIRLRCFTNSEW